MRVRTATEQAQHTGQGMMVVIKTGDSACELTWQRGNCTHNNALSNLLHASAILLV